MSADQTDILHLGHYAMSIQAIDPSEFRNAMRSHAAAVVVVTTELKGVKYGVTINSMTSVSLAPAIVLVCLNNTSETIYAIRERGSFCLNILEESQEAISRQFVSKNVDRFANVALDQRRDGMPLISGATAHLVCDVQSIDMVGDHFVVFGHVVECRSASMRPLLYFKGQYCRIAS